LWPVAFTFTYVLKVVTSSSTGNSRLTLTFIRTQQHIDSRAGGVMMCNTTFSLS